MSFPLSFDLLGAADFNGDNTRGLIYRRSSDGLTEIQFLSSTGTASGGGPITNNPFGADWQPAGAGDTNGDGKADIIWWRPADGAVEVQFMSGGAAIGGGSVANSPFGVDWAPVGTDDFNGDGKQDVVWRRKSDGLVELQFLNGANAVGGGVIANSSTFDNTWSIPTTGDFNGDGHKDLLYQRNSDGLLEIQLLNGAQGIGGGAIANNPFSQSQGWLLGGAGDFNGDGKTDLLFERVSDGLVEVEYLNGNTAIGGGDVTGLPSGVNPANGWAVVSTADFDVNHDGKADLVARNVTTGQTEIMLLNGTSVTSFTAADSPVTQQVAQLFQGAATLMPAGSTQTTQADQQELGAPQQQALLAAVSANLHHA